jgi:hypothetical protein
MDRELFLALIAAQQNHNMTRLEVENSYAIWQFAQKQQQESLQRLAKLRQQVAPHFKDGETISIWVDGTQFAISPVSHPAEIEVRVVKNID